MELILRLLQSDVEAFDALYGKYHQAVYLNTLKLVRDETVAEEIVQDVFVALWEKRRQIRTDQNLPGWLFVVSYNKSVNFLKARLRTELARHELAERAAAVNDGAGMGRYLPADEKALAEIRWSLLEEAIRRLSPQRRRVFVLCKLEGKTYEETALELHLSKHTVKEYLSGAISFIEEYIRKQPEYLLPLSGGIFFSIFL